MVGKTFGENNNQSAFANSEAEKKQIQEVTATAAEKLNLDEASKALYTSSIQESGTLRRFGAGSLLTYSHLETGPPVEGEKQWKPSLLEKFPNINTDKIYSVKTAALEGYENDFVCHDIHYRGTKENPGITIGIDEVKGGITNGGVLETDLTQLGLTKDEMMAFIKYDAEEFVAREFPPNMPIYKFGLKEVKYADGTTQPSLACIADQEGPLYAGNLSFKERAAILGTAMGPTVNPQTGQAKGKGLITDIDYMRTTIDSMINNKNEAGDPDPIPVPERFIVLYQAGIEMRNEAEPSKVSELQSHEKDNAHDGVIEFLYKEKGQEKPSKARWNLEQNSSLDLHYDA